MRIRFWVLIVLMVVVALPAPGTGQLPSDGRTSGRSKSGGDPNRVFDMMSGGKDIIIRDTLTSSFTQGMFDRFAQGMGITDGKITRAQFTAYMQQKAAAGDNGSMKPSSTGSAPTGGPGFSGKGSDRSGGPTSGDPSEMIDRWAEGTFRRMDVNGDGLLNYDEMSENLRAERDKWDTNHDGFIDLNEFKAYFRAYMQQRMAERGGGFPGMMGADGSLPLPVPDGPIEEEDHKPAVWRAGKLPKDLPAWFKSLDTDGDGQVSLFEWRSGGKSIEEFQRMDRNGDGFLTIAEVLYYHNGKNNLNGVAVVANPSADKKGDLPAAGPTADTKGTESKSFPTKSSSGSPEGKSRGNWSGGKSGRPN
jgi:EF hand domain-containing protein